MNEIELLENNFEKTGENEYELADIKVKVNSRTFQIFYKGKRLFCFYKKKDQPLIRVFLTAYIRTKNIEKTIEAVNEKVDELERLYGLMQYEL